MFAPPPRYLAMDRAFRKLTPHRKRAQGSRGSSGLGFFWAQAQSVRPSFASVFGKTQSLVQET